MLRFTTRPTFDLAVQGAGKNEGSEKMVMTRISGQNSVLLAIVGFGVLAGVAFIFVKVLVAELTPLQVVASRTMAGSVAVVGVMLMTRISMPKSMAFVRGVIVLGVLDGVAPYLLIAHAQVHVTSATARDPGLDHATVHNALRMVECARASLGAQRHSPAQSPGLPALPSSSVQTH